MKLVCESSLLVSRQDRPTVPPSGERTAIIITIAVALTRHSCHACVSRTQTQFKRLDVISQAILRLRRRCVLIAAMPILKKRDHQTELRLLLESDEPIELPPADVADNAVLVQFDKFKPFIPELIEALQTGTIAEPVPVMNDGSTFMIHGQTRTFWVKLWHTAGTELTKIERAQVISCLPSTRGTSVFIGDE